METNQKTFRYSFFLRNLGVFYLMFLVSCVLAGLIAGIREFMFYAIMIGVGVVLLLIFLTSTVSTSELGISTKTLFGIKSLKWSEISRISSKGSSLKLHDHDGDTTLSINPRLDGSVEIFNLLFSKRPDLFAIQKNNPLSRSFRSNAIRLAAGLLLVILSVLLYFYRNYFYIPGVLGLLLCLESLLNWYFSPHSIALENDRLVVNYLNRSLRFSANDIEAIQIGSAGQNQFESVLIVFRDKKVMKVAGFKQAPLIIYPVLQQWHQNYAARQPDPSI